MMKDDHIRV